MIDTDKYEETDHPELVEFEGETLGDTLTNLLAEVERLRSIADDLYAYIVSDAGISLSIIEEQMDWWEEGDD